MARKLIVDDVGDIINLELASRFTAMTDSDSVIGWKIYLMNGPAARVSLLANEKYFHLTNRWLRNNKLKEPLRDSAGRFTSGGETS